MIVYNRIPSLLFTVVYDFVADLQNLKPTWDTLNKKIHQIDPLTDSQLFKKKKR